VREFGIRVRDHLSVFVCIGQVGHGGEVSGGTLFVWSRNDYAISSLSPSTWSTMARYVPYRKQQQTVVQHREPSHGHDDNQRRNPIFLIMILITSVSYVQFKIHENTRYFLPPLEYLAT
jgi:hypothetical protein